MLFRKKNHHKHLSNADQRDLESYITKNFGEFSVVLHEITSPSLPIDIAVVPPSEQHNYYTLVTMGMGAYRMKLPRAMRAKVCDRAELVLNLPPDWPVEQLTNQTSWPIRFMTEIARFPQSFRSWVADGHTIPNFENRAFDESTRINCAMLVSVKDSRGLPRECITSHHHTFRFYRLLFLYPEETSYKLNYGPEALLSLMEAQADFTDVRVLHPQRRNFCSAIQTHAPNT